LGQEIAELSVRLDAATHRLLTCIRQFGAPLTWLQEWADERGLDLGPDANLPLWDGTRPDYDLAVAGLLRG